MVWPHPLDVIQYARSSYYYNNVYIFIINLLAHRKEAWQIPVFLFSSWKCDLHIAVWSRSILSATKATQIYHQMRKQTMQGWVTLTTRSLAKTFRENMICSLCLPHIFECPQDYYWKQTLWTLISLIWVHVLCNIDYLYSSSDEKALIVNGGSVDIPTNSLLANTCTIFFL